MIPSFLVPHIHEDRSIIQQYTKSRAMHAILQVQTQTELDAHFGVSLCHPLPFACVNTESMYEMNRSPIRIINNPLLVVTT